MSEAAQQTPVYEPVLDPWSVPLDQVDPAFRRLFQEDRVLEVVGDAVRTRHVFIRGFTELPVRLTAR